MSMTDRFGRASRRLRVALGASTLIACSPEPTVDIIGAIELSSDAIHVEEAGAGTHGIGLLGEAVVLSGVVRDPRAPRVAPFGAVARWFDLEGEPLGPATDLGSSAGYPHGWARFEGALYAQHWGDPERYDDVREDALVHLLRASPDEGFSMVRIAMQLAPPPADCPGCAQLLASSTRPLPTLALSDRVIGALGGMPGFPGCDGTTNYERLHLFDSIAQRGAFLDWTGEHPCSLSPHEAIGGSAQAPFLVRLASGEPAVLLRPADGDYRIHLLRLDPTTLTPVGTPRLIGDERGGGTGLQPEPQAAVVGNRIVFTEKTHPERSCARLRVTNDDGSNAREAPWQLPCATEGTERWVTTYASLAAVEAGVIVVWDQRSGPVLSFDPVSADPDYEEGIFAVLLTPDGRRGSEIIEITGPDHTAAIDGFRGDYQPMVAVEGDRVVVAWNDARSDAPGLYLRFLRFVRTAASGDDE